MQQGNTVPDLVWRQFRRAAVAACQRHEEGLSRGGLLAFVFQDGVVSIHLVRQRRPGS